MVKSIGKKLKNCALKFQNDENAQMHNVGAMYAVIFLIVLVFIAVVLFTFIPGMGSTIATSVPSPPPYGVAGGEWNTTALTSVAATGTFTFSGNVSNGELVNITNGAAVYRFEFNTTGNGSNTAAVLTANAIRINLSMEPNLLNVRNTSILASGNLTAAINANVSTSALVTAANTTNLTTLTAVTAGTGANSISLADNAANIASSGMSGGSEANPNAVALASASGVSLWTSSSGMFKIAIIIIILALVIASLLGMLAIRRQQGGGGSPM